MLGLCCFEWALWLWWKGFSLQMASWAKGFSGCGSWARRWPPSASRARCAVHSRPVVSDCLRPVDCSSPGSSVHGILQARVLEWVATPSLGGVGGGVFPTQGSSLGLLHCRQILYLLSHQGSPWSLKAQYIIVVVWGLSSPVACRIFLDQGFNPCIGRQTPNN